MEQDSTRRVTEGLLAGSEDTLAAPTGIAIVEASTECAAATMPVAGEAAAVGA